MDWMTGNKATLFSFLVLLLTFVAAHKQSVSDALAPYLNKLGQGWKTMLGLAGLFVLTALGHYGVITVELQTDLGLLFAVLTGIGIIHKEVLR